MTTKQKMHKASANNQSKEFDYFIGEDSHLYIRHNIQSFNTAHTASNTLSLTKSLGEEKKVISFAQYNNADTDTVLLCVALKNNEGQTELYMQDSAPGYLIAAAAVSWKKLPIAALEGDINHVDLDSKDGIFILTKKGDEDLVYYHKLDKTGSTPILLKGSNNQVIQEILETQEIFSEFIKNLVEVIPNLSQTIHSKTSEILEKLNKELTPGYIKQNLSMVLNKYTVTDLLKEAQQRNTEEKLKSIKPPFSNIDKNNQLLFNFLLEKLDVDMDLKRTETANSFSDIRKNQEVDNVIKLVNGLIKDVDIGKFINVELITETAIADLMGVFNSDLPIINVVENISKKIWKSNSSLESPILALFNKLITEVIPVIACELKFNEILYSKFENIPKVFKVLLPSKETFTLLDVISLGIAIPFYAVYKPSTGRVPSMEDTEIRAFIELPKFWIQNKSHCYRLERNSELKEGWEFTFSDGFGGLLRIVRSALTHFSSAKILNLGCFRENSYLDPNKGPGYTCPSCSDQQRCIKQQKCQIKADDLDTRNEKRRLYISGLDYLLCVVDYFITFELTIRNCNAARSAAKKYSLMATEDYEFKFELKQSQEDIDKYKVDERTALILSSKDKSQIFLIIKGKPPLEIPLGDSELSQELYNKLSDALKNEKTFEFSKEENRQLIGFAKHRKYIEEIYQISLKNKKPDKITKYNDIFLAWDREDSKMYSYIENQGENTSLEIVKKTGNKETELGISQKLYDLLKERLSQEKIPDILTEEQRYEILYFMQNKGKETKESQSTIWFIIGWLVIIAALSYLFFLEMLGCAILAEETSCLVILSLVIAILTLVTDIIFVIQMPDPSTGDIITRRGSTTLLVIFDLIVTINSILDFVEPKKDGWSHNTKKLIDGLITLRSLIMLTSGVVRISQN